MNGENLFTRLIQLPNLDYLPSVKKTSLQNHNTSIMLDSLFEKGDDYADI